MAGSAFAFSKSKLGRLTSNIDGLRDRYEGDDDYWKDAIDREGNRDRRAEDNFDQSIRVLGVRGEKRLLLGTSDIDGGII